MKILLIWIALILSYVVHFTWVLWGLWLVDKLTPIKNQVGQWIFLLCTWVLIVIACSGCPFSYLHQYLQVQIGLREEITYQYEDSIAYQYVIDPVQTLTGLNSDENGK